MVNVNEFHPISRAKLSFSYKTKDEHSATAVAQLVCILPQMLENLDVVSVELLLEISKVIR